MTEEVSLSIDETNKLRAGIGLEPIPIPGDDNVAKPHREREKELATSTTRDEISIEETNKLRLSLGLKPIPIDDVSGLDKQDREVENFNKHQSEIRDKEKETLLKQRIDNAKVQNLNRKRLTPRKTSLYDDEDNAPESTDVWLKKLGQAQVKTKKQKTQGSESDETNGLRIGHNSKDLSKLGNDEILNLKDTGLLEEDDDELINETLIRNAKFEKDLQHKRGADNVKNNGRRAGEFSTDYENNDNDEENDNLMITGATIKLPTKDTTEKKKSTEMESSKGHVRISNLFSDDEISETQPASDYSKSNRPVKMKKLKKKSSLNSRKKNEVHEDSKDADKEISIKAVELENLDPAGLFADDMELSSILSMKRQLKQKKRKFLTPEQITKEVKLFTRWEQENEIEAVSAQHDEGIVFDDTSDFLNSLNANILADKKDEKPDNSSDVKLEPEITPEPKIKIEEDGNMLVNDNHNIPPQTESSDGIFIEKEDDSSPTFNGGLASTLKFLQSRQILQKQTSDEYEKSKQQREALKLAELLKLKISIESRLLREQLEADKPFMNLPREEREDIFESHLDQVLKEKNIIYNTTNSRRKENYSKPSTKDNLSNYSPLVKLSYRDESGNVLNTKEAFKYMSHKFHGVGPGKGKIDKKLKKLQQERDKDSSNNEEII